MAKFIHLTLEGNGTVTQPIKQTVIFIYFARIEATEASQLFTSRLIKNPRVFHQVMGEKNPTYTKCTSITSAN